MMRLPTKPTIQGRVIYVLRELGGNKTSFEVTHEVNAFTTGPRIADMSVRSILYKLHAERRVTAVMDTEAGRNRWSWVPQHLHGAASHG